MRWTVGRLRGKIVSYEHFSEEKDEYKEILVYDPKHSCGFCILLLLIVHFTDF